MLTFPVFIPMSIPKIFTKGLVVSLALHLGIVSSIAEEAKPAPVPAKLIALHQAAEHKFSYNPSNKNHNWAISYWGCENADLITEGSPMLLTSPAFEIVQPYVFFSWAGKHSCTAASLEVDGKPVALGLITGDWRCWDVTAYVGRKAVFKIYDVDRHDPKSKGDASVFQARDLVADFPPVPQFTPEKIAGLLPDRIAFDPKSDAKRSQKRPSDYSEKHRPQFHFTRNEGWMNDPNGMIYHEGEYHLCFQAQNFWGRAVSKDMVQWQQVDDAFGSDNLGAAWSGSTVIDWKNTGGFQTGKEPAMVTLYTSCGSPKLNPKEALPNLQLQSIVYSNDRGRTWVKIPNNPVMRHMHRDPKVFWHEPTKRWIMVLMLRQLGTGFFSSADLKQWRKESVCKTWEGECPDFFSLQVNGQTKWVGMNAPGRYWIGDFDGKTFKPETESLRVEYGPNFYASQVFNNMPDDRVVIMTWMNAHGQWGDGPGSQAQGVPKSGQYPDAPYNQQLSFPRDLSLRSTEKGLRLFMNPVAEIRNIYTQKHEWQKITLKPGENPLKDLKHDLYDLTAIIEPITAKEVGFIIAGEKISITPTTKKINFVGRSAEVDTSKALKLRLLIDRTSIEIFINDGEKSITTVYMRKDDAPPLTVFTEGGESTLSLEVNELKSIWKN